MTETEKKHKVFIKEMIRTNDRTASYLKAYPESSKESARVASYALLQNITIKEAVEKGLKKKEELIEQVQTEEIKKKAKAEILSIAQVDAILSKIIDGTLTVKRKVPYADPKTGRVKYRTVEQRPTIQDRKSAADIYFKRFGVYINRIVDETPDRVIRPGAKNPE